MTNEQIKEMQEKRAEEQSEINEKAQKRKEREEHKKLEELIAANAEIMRKCVLLIQSKATPDETEEAVAPLVVALFRSIVPSAGQLEAAKRATDMIEAGLEMLQAVKPPVMHSVPLYSERPPGSGPSEFGYVMPEDAAKWRGAVQSGEPCYFCGRPDQARGILTPEGAKGVCDSCLNKHHYLMRLEYARMPTGPPPPPPPAPPADPPWGTAGPGTCSYCGGVGIVQHCRVRDDSRLLCTLCAAKLEAGTLKEDGYISDASAPQPERWGTCAVCDYVKKVDVYARSFRGDLSEVLLCRSCFSKHLQKREEKLERERMRHATEEETGVSEGIVCYHCNVRDENGVVVPSADSGLSIVLCRKCIRDIARRLTSEETARLMSEEVDPPAPSAAVGTDEDAGRFAWQVAGVTGGTEEAPCFHCGAYGKDVLLIGGADGPLNFALCVDCLDAIEKSRKGSDD